MWLHVVLAPLECRNDARPDERLICMKMSNSYQGRFCGCVCVCIIVKLFIVGIVRIALFARFVVVVVPDKLSSPVFRSFEVVTMNAARSISAGIKDTKFDAAA